MPPATSTTSPPSPSGDVPARRRTGRAPRGRRPAARRPAPGSRRRRRGWCAAARSRSAGSPLIEIGTSPTPNACSMVNWPGAEAPAARRRRGSSHSVTVSRGVLAAADAPGTGAAASGPADRARRRSRRLRSVRRHRGAPYRSSSRTRADCSRLVHHAARPAASARSRARGPRRTCPAGSAPSTTISGRLARSARASKNQRYGGTSQDQPSTSPSSTVSSSRAPAGRARGPRGRPVPCGRRRTCRRARPPGTGTSPGADVHGSSRSPRCRSSAVVVEPDEERVLRRAPGASSARHASPGRLARVRLRMAATSSVMSMPAGHQVMQRPQPTQPDDAELVDPGGELVGHPLPVPRTDATAARCRRAGRRSRR